MGSRLHIVTPTFREPGHVADLIGDLRSQDFTGFSLRIVNSAPGDETSALIAGCRDMDIREVPAAPEIFWTGAVAMGIEDVLREAGKDDMILLLNCDIRLKPDFLRRYLAAASERPGACFCAASARGGRFVSSGAVMVSWPLSLTRHELTGPRRPVAERFVPVDMLAGRALLFPASLIGEIGNFAADRLPHYAADYEFTARAKAAGHPLYVVSDVVLESDTRNTGGKAFQADKGLRERIALLFSLRSPLNLRYRSRFALMTYPGWTAAAGVLSLTAKALIEVLFGRLAYRLLRSRHVTD